MMPSGVTQQQPSRSIARSFHWHQRLRHFPAIGNAVTLPIMMGRRHLDQ